MAEAKYRGVYLATRRAWRPVVERGDAECHEPICLMPSRHIAPGSPWDLSHDVTGTRILGPSHSTCNRTEGAIRGGNATASRFLKL